MTRRWRQFGSADRRRLSGIAGQQTVVSTLAGRGLYLAAWESSTASGGWAWTLRWRVDPIGPSSTSTGRRPPGRPFAATGGRMLAQTAKSRRRRRRRRTAARADFDLRGRRPKVAAVEDDADGSVSASREVPSGRWAAQRNVLGGFAPTSRSLPITRIARVNLTPTPTAMRGNP